MEMEWRKMVSGVGRGDYKLCKDCRLLGVVGQGRKDLRVVGWLSF